MNTTWIEFSVVGPVDTMRYRTNHDASIVQFWSEHRVPGFAGRGWNTTKSLTVKMRAKAALKDIDDEIEAAEAAAWTKDMEQMRWAERGGYAAGLPRPGR